MSDFRHLGFFPFCIGYEPNFEFDLGDTIYGSGKVSSYASVLKLPLKDAMALYWKSKKAILSFDFQYTGLSTTIDPQGPIGRKETVYSLSDTQELNFYTTNPTKNEIIANRACFDDSENEPFLSYSSFVGGGGKLGFYISFFSDTYGIVPTETSANRVFLNSNIPSTPQKIFPDDEIFVNLIFYASHEGDDVYSRHYATNFPHLVPEYIGSNGFLFLTHSFLKIKINNNIYDVEIINWSEPVISPPRPIYNIEIIT